MQSLLNLLLCIGNLCAQEAYVLTRVYPDSNSYIVGSRIDSTCTMPDRRVADMPVYYVAYAPAVLVGRL